MRRDYAPPRVRGFDLIARDRCGVFESLLHARTELRLCFAHPAPERRPDFGGLQRAEHLEPVGQSLRADAHMLRLAEYGFDFGGRGLERFGDRPRDLLPRIVRDDET